MKLPPSLSTAHPRPLVHLGLAELQQERDFWVDQGRFSKSRAGAALAAQYAAQCEALIAAKLERRGDSSFKKNAASAGLK